MKLSGFWEIIGKEEIKQEPAELKKEAENKINWSPHGNK